MRNMDYILDCAAGSTGHGAGTVVNLNDILNCSKKKMHDAYSYPQEKSSVPDDILNCITREKAAFSHKDDILHCISLTNVPIAKCETVVTCPRPV